MRTSFLHLGLVTALSGVFGLASPTAQAAVAKPGAALAAVAPDTAQRLRETLSTQDSPGLLALRQKLAALRQELDASASADRAAVGALAAGAPDGARSQVGAATPDQSSATLPLEGRRVASHRVEMAQLRRQVMAELQALQAQVRASAGDAQGDRVARLIADAGKRFDDIDAALDVLEQGTRPSRTAATAADPVARTRLGLSQQLARLSGPGELISATPVPTLVPLPPIGREPGLDAPSRVAPSYARAGSGSTELATAPAPSGWGYVKVATVLRPVAPDTATDCSASAADLAADGAEIVLTPEIRALAQSLNYSPVRILRWMHTNVAFRPYWGSLKGATGVLLTREGNATDQSSLMIALLRASNIPARYVRGTVGLLDAQPANDATGRAQRWLGTKNYSASVAYLSSGVPAGPFTFNGSVQGLSFDHVWVQACVPFAAYRGSLDDSRGYRWLPLDPSVKDADYQAGMAVNVPLDAASGFYSAYLASRTGQLPPDYLADKTEAAARAIRSDASVEDVPYRGKPRTLRFDVLPSALPYLVGSFSAWPGSTLPETAAIPDAHRHKFSVSVKNGSGTVLASGMVSLPQAVLGKLTVSYLPDAASQALWNAWAGSLSALPAGSVNVYPRILLDGAVLASGSAASTLALGGVHNVTMKLTQGEKTGGQCINDNGNPGSASDPDASCLNKTVYANIRAGGYYALGFNAGQATLGTLAASAERLAGGVRTHPSAPTPAAGAAYDATVGELLHLVLQSYQHDVDAADRRIAELRGFKSTGLYDIGLTGADLKTDYLFDLPLTVKPAGVYIDYKGGTYGFTRIDTAADFGAGRGATLKSEQIELSKLSIYAGSALEHFEWQQALRTDAISTVRGLQYANETGTSLVTFTAANIGSYDSLTVTSGPGSMASFKAAIQAEVAAGASVTVPRAQISYSDPVDTSKAWRGAVYMTENASTGGYGAIINGSISGGFPLLNSTPFFNLFNPNSTAPAYTTASADGPSWWESAKRGWNSFTTTAGDPVNMLTGNLIHDHTDFAIKGRGGLPIVLQRWYNSQQPQDGPLGYGWTHSFNHFIKLHGVEGGVAKVGWISGNGGESFFSTTSHSGGDIARGATLTNSSGSYVQFTRVSGGADDGRFRIRERDGTVYLFASATGPNVTPTASSAVTARLLSITDRKGNALTLNYSGSQLASVTDSLARTVLSFTWTGSRITQVADYSGRTVKYAYTDGNGNLNKVTDPLNQDHLYSYYSAADGPKRDHHLKRHTLPRGNGMEFEYYSGGQVFTHTPFDTSGTLQTASKMGFRYNLFNRETWTVNERGYERHFFFDSYGNISRIVEENGAVHTYAYDPARPFNRIKEVDPAGRTTLTSYNAADLVETVTLPSGAVQEYRDYNAFAQPQRIKDERGNWRWLRYNSAGSLTDAIALRSGVAGTAGTLPSSSDILAWTKTSYDSAGNPLTSTRVKDFVAATGPSLTQTWDANKLNLLRLTRAGNRNGAVVNETTPTFTYDSLNRLRTGVDARWYPLALGYDALDRITSATDALGKPRSASFDANGNVRATELVDAGLRIDSSANTFDGLDRLTRSLDHAGNLSTVSYDAAGNPVARTSPDNFTLTTEFDASNRPFAVYDAENNRVFTQLDPLGRPVQTTDPNANTTRYSYWGASSFDGRLKRITQPTLAGQASGRALEFDYDASGRTIRTRAIAADGSSTRQSFSFYDELGRLTRSLSAPDDTGNRLQFCSKFDTLSNPTEVWAGPSTDTTSTVCAFADPSLKRQQSASWDDFGQRLTSTDALGKTWAFSYDLYGNLATSQTPEQARISAATKTSYAYDPALNGALKTRTVPAMAGGASTGQTATWTRNPLGQVTRAETKDAAGTTVVAYDYGYDTAHRLSSITDGRGGKVLGYQWTPGGRLSAVTLADSAAATPTHRWDFKYDAVGRLSALVAPNGQTLVLTLDPGGRLKERSLGNSLTSRYAWHSEGSLQSITHLLGASTGVNGTVAASSAYTYDLWGNRQTAAQNTGGTTTHWAYGYDALNRLKSSSNGTATQDEGYGFDIFGNRVTKTVGSPVTQSFTSTFDAAHQLTQVQQTVGGTAVTLAQRYDDNGNLKKSCESAGGTITTTATDCTLSGAGSTTSLTWDGLGQLVALAKAGGAALNEAYAYDDAGRRIRKTSGAATTHYLYNGQDIAAEWTGSAVSGAPAAVYAHGARTDEPLLRLTGSSGSPAASSQAYLADGLGSIVAALSNTSAGGVATAISVTPTNSLSEGSYPSAKLIDGDTSGASGIWAGNLAPSASVSLDLGGTQTLSRVKLWRASSFNPDYIVRTASVEVRGTDGVWRPAGSLTNNTTVDSPEIGFTAMTGTAVRVTITAARNATIVALAEVGLSLDPGPAATATQGFDAWGQVLSAVSAIPTYGYTGREPDASGLVYYRARYYQPGTGRFASRDPIGLAGGINPYSYVDGNPVTFNDPSGLLASRTWNTGLDYTGKAIDWMGRNSTQILDGGQTLLDLAGLVPGFGEIADGANALIYWGRGDNLNAGLSAAAMVPFAGWGATAAKVGVKADNAIDAGQAAAKSGVPGTDFIPGSNVTEKYARPTDAGPTAAQRESVQGKPCVDCGAVTPNQVADHIDPLVVQHYREGKVDSAAQRQVDAVQPHCPSCSASQGGQLGAFAKRMRNFFGF